MKALMLNIFLLFLIVVEPIFADNQHGDSEHHHHLHQKAHHNSHNREHYRNNQENHHHYFLRHHKGWKAREAGSEICENICDIELLTVLKWLNGTKELHFLYEIVPPSVKNAISGIIKPTTSNPQHPTATPSVLTTSGDNGPNLNPISLFNGSLPVDLDKLYNAKENWPILSYLARLFALFLSRAHGLSQLFSIFPEFGNVWKIIVQAIIGRCSRVEFFLDNLRELFGFNGPIGGNLLNLTYWEHIFSPSGVVEGIEHAINKFNLTNLTG